MEIKLIIDNKVLSGIEDVLSSINNLINVINKQMLYNDSSASVKQETPTSAVSSKSLSQDQKQSFTFEEVRSYLTDRSRDGFTSEVKALVTKYGSGKLSLISPDSYPALMLEAQFRCREPLTKVDIVKRVDELISEGYKDQISEIFTRSFATSADDLLEENYAAFMIDSWGLDHEW